TASRTSTARRRIGIREELGRSPFRASHTRSARCPARRRAACRRVRPPLAPEVADRAAAAAEEAEAAASEIRGPCLYCARNVSTFTSIALSAASTRGDTLG